MLERPARTHAMTALLVEDDERLAKLTMEYLARHEVSVEHVADGPRGLDAATRKRWDVIVLDLMLPGKDGLTICRQVRELSDVPIVIITARVEEPDRVIGLEMGADDYVVKPYSPRELLARMRAVVRRDRGELGPSSQVVRVGRLAISPSSRRVEVDGREVSVTTAEFDVLLSLARHAGRVLSREQLLALARGGTDEAFDRSIDVHVSRVRAKLGAAGAMIRTVRGVGYLLSDEGGAP
jgi:two-component system, OmpR family, response regulator